MFLDADLIQREVAAPINNWCACGHQAPPMFKRQGANSVDEPIRFFLIQGNEINGIYCEPCLIIANWISLQNKKSKR